MKETLYFGKTFDEIFEKSFKKFTRGVEDHSFKHYNDSLGMYIYSKEHLRQEMKKRRMLPIEVCEHLAEKWESENKPKEYNKLSESAMDIIKSLHLVADRNGNIRLGGRAIQKLKELGAINDPYEYRGVKGGFY